MDKWVKNTGSLSILVLINFLFKILVIGKKIKNYC